MVGCEPNLPAACASAHEKTFWVIPRQHVIWFAATALQPDDVPAAPARQSSSSAPALAQAAGKLGSHPTIAGWLHQTALNKSREWLRSELRRRRREQVAVNLDLAGRKAIPCGRRSCRCSTRRFWSFANRTGWR